MPKCVLSDEQKRGWISTQKARLPSFQKLHILAYRLIIHPVDRKIGPIAKSIQLDEWLTGQWGGAPRNGSSVPEVVASPLPLAPYNALLNHPLIGACISYKRLSGS